MPTVKPNIYRQSLIFSLITKKPLLANFYANIIYTKAGMATLLCSKEKNGLKKLGGHKDVSKKAWRAKFNHVKTHNRAILTF